MYFINSADLYRSLALKDNYKVGYTYQRVRLILSFQIQSNPIIWTADLIIYNRMVWITTPQVVYKKIRIFQITNFEFVPF